jgi:AhpD family alkylhydroperoxidase
MMARELRPDRRHGPGDRRYPRGPVASVPLLGVDQAPLLARPYYEGGDPGPIVAALAHVPELLEACLPFLGVVFGPTALPGRTKELVILRTSARLSCRYCLEAHSVSALDAGLSPAEVRALRQPEADVGAFADPAELALLAWADAVAGEAGPVDPRRQAALARHFTDPEVVELTLLLGVTVMLNRFCTALDLPTSPETLRRLAEAGLT